MKTIKILMIALMASFVVTTVNAQTSPAKTSTKHVKVDKKVVKAEKKADSTAKKPAKKAAKKPAVKK